MNSSEKPLNPDKNLKERQTNPEGTGMGIEEPTEIEEISVQVGVTENKQASSE